jgi:hypothetical protein
MTAWMLAACAGDIPTFPAQQDASPAPPPPDGTAAAQLDCPTYCSRVMSACTGANLQYATMDSCVASCAHFPIGTLADTSGNSIGCRMYHAMNAISAPDTHCLHAGPAGGGHCGTPCEGFCSIVTQVCTTEYPTLDSCATACAGFAAAPDYTFNVATGNTRSCRIHHATNAAIDPTTHCPHTAVASTPCQ